MSVGFMPALDAGLFAAVTERISSYELLAPENPPEGDVGARSSTHPSLAGGSKFSQGKRKLKTLQVLCQYGGRINLEHRRWTSFFPPNSAPLKRAWPKSAPPSATITGAGAIRPPAFRTNSIARWPRAAGSASPCRRLMAVLALASRKR